MKTIVYVNQKGGSAKSVTSYNFAYYLAKKRGHRVLFIDADQQGNSSSSLRTCMTSLTASQFYDDKPISFPLSQNPIVLARGDDSLRLVESWSDERIVTQLAARLKEAAKYFDYCVVDTPGSNSKSVGAFLINASHVIIPTEIDSYSLSVTLTVLQRVVGVQQHFNKNLVNLGLLPTRLKASVNQRRDLEGLMRDYSKYVLRACLADRMPYREAADEGVPVWEYTKRQKRDELGKPVFDGKGKPVMERVSNESAATEILAAFDLIYKKVNGQ